MLTAWCVFCDGYHLNIAGENYPTILLLCPCVMCDIQVVMRWWQSCDQGLGMWPLMSSHPPSLILSSPHAQCVFLFSPANKRMLNWPSLGRQLVTIQSAEITAQTTQPGTCYNSGWDGWCSDVSSVLLMSSQAPSGQWPLLLVTCHQSPLFGHTKSAERYLWNFVRKSYNNLRTDHGQ